ncbi:S-layer homology domain-containing protein [Paenibacillus sp. TAB 01]|uniref:S-layer homology domain-containing protein n=1 Tax=Paenibacillus sp. TAB 01 TaxID=3368988 RepID=UPI003751BF9E
MNKRISLVLVLALVFSLIQPVWSMRLALASGDMVKPADKDVYFDNDGSHVSGEDIGALIGGGPLYVNFVGPDSEYGNQRTMINFADLDSDLPTTISSVTMRLFIPYVFVHTNAPYDAVVTVNASNITNWEADSVSDFPADNNDPLLDHLQNIRVATKKNNGMNNEDTVDPGNVDTTSTGCTPIPGVLLGCLNLDVTDYVKNKISGGAADITFLLSGATLQTTSAYFTIYPNENETYRPQLIFAGETAPVPAQTAEAGAQTLTPVAGADNTVTLTVKDSQGNVDTSFTGSHSVTISGVEPSPNGTYGSFAGTALDASAAGGGQAIGVTFTDGVATAALALHQAEAQTIGFSIAGVATPATNSLTITPKAEALAALTLSQDITAPPVNGGTFAQQPVVKLVDAYGNLVSTDSSTQVTASKKDAGSWTLTGTATVTANAGVATFSGLGAANAAEVSGAQLAFHAGALPEITSTAVMLPAPASAQTAEAGAQTLTPVAGADNTVTLTVKDSLGNVDTSFTGTHSVTINGAEPAPNGTYGTFAGTALDASAAGAGQSIDVTFTNGVATAALALHQAEAQTIGFSIAGVATPATNSLTITPKAGALAALTLSQDITAPSVNGGTFAQQPVVKLVDAYGNLVSTDSSTQVTASKKDAGSWTLTGTATVTANAGVATFSGLGAANAAEVSGAQLAFHAGALPEITSTAVMLPAPASAQTAEAGAQTLTPEAGADNTVTLTVKDSLGNVDTSFAGSHSVTINGAEPAPNGTYGTFAETALDASAAGGGQAISATFANGVATAALALNKAESQTIGFSIAGVATPATNSLTIAPKAGALAALTLSQDVTAPPVNGGVFAQQPVVKLVDAYGNLVSTDSSTQVTASKKDAGSWTLTGTATVTANAGVATFSGLGAANAAEVSGAQLAFHAGALPEITSTAVMLPAPASAQTAEAGAQTLTPEAGADNTVTLTVKDSLGNVDTSFTGTHSVTINGAAPNGTYGTFAGTALDASAAGAGQSIDVTFTNGAATAALALNKAESQTIGFSIAGVATPATNSLTIAPKAGALAALTLSQDVTAPPVNGGAFAQQPVVKLVDAYGNLVSTDSSTQVTVSRKDAGSWTLTGKATVTANAGVATFSGLGAVNAVEVSGAQLAFHAGGLQEITSSKLMLLWPDPTAPVLTLLEVKDQSVTIGWEPVYGSVTYSVYQRTGNEIYIDPTMTVAGSVYNATITGLINGITYSFVIKASHPGGASGFSNEVSATPSTVPASPTNVTAVAGNGQATISFTIPADDGGSPITAYEVTASPGNVVITGTSSPITVTGLTNGTSYTFTVKAVNGAGSSASSAESNVVRPVAPSRNNHNSSPSSPSTPSSQTDTPSQTETTDVGVNVFVNGKVENAGTATISQKDNQTVTTIAVDQKKLDDKLAAEGQGALVTIPLNTKSDVVVGELTGQMVKNMEDKQAVLQIKTDQASYTLPANQINIGSVSAQIGTSVALSDIKVQIEIAAPAADTVKVVENAAKQGTFTLVVPPVEFTVRAVHGDKTIEVTKFNAYVERTIAIPDGVDPSKITTGVVVDPDGTVRHVPTKVVQMEGKYYAVINSLTNSTYSVVWHPITFSDVANHWSKDAVNDMGSRMVINGTGEDTFSPDRDITRAEFAAIIVRGLGLRLEKGVAPFSDVKESDWYSGAIKTAYEYHLINGFEDGTFHPMDNITREQAMVILSEAMRLTELKAKLEPKAAEETLRAFTDDSSASPWAADGIADSVEAGIVSGREGMQLAPKAFITRAEVAAMIKRLLQNSGLI